MQKILMAMRASAWLLLALSSIAQAQTIHTTEAPLAPQEAARSMVVPEGFHVSLFAGEPDVKQPIAFCVDDRGRLWVAEAYNYPHHGDRPGDRIVIFEDQDGDGQFDKRTVFYDQLNYVTGIEYGFGGVWVMSPPNFYFIPDRNGDDQPDEEPHVMLTGFGNHANAHNMANGFAWGPDGWLYGTHGRTNWSLIGKPGAAEDERERFDGGVWRYHPVRHVWQPYADGTTNPWGIDWDDYGEAFVCNCVNPHLFHVIQGAHYEPWRNRASSRFAYERIDTIADHRHFIGEGNVRQGNGTPEQDEAGGGHAHCGTLVYLGDNWPDRYRNTVLMNNIHGRRINNDILRRRGSGYTASHGPDLMISQDPWYMGVTLRLAPDGGVFASDWSDTGECHSTRDTKRQTGRIYKITFGKPEAKPVDLARQDDKSLVELQLHRNEWFVRHARRLLHERAALGEDMANVIEQLHEMFATQQDVTRKLRALWALRVVDGLSDDFLVRQLDHESEYIRGWVVRLLCEDREPPQAALVKFGELAANGESPLVRLQLASAMQHISHAQRWPIVESLCSRGADAADANLPLMYWYAAEPLITDDVARFAELGATTTIPLIQRHVARRIAESESPQEDIRLLVGSLANVQDKAHQNQILEGLLKGLEGRRSMKMPSGWSEAYEKLKETKDSAITGRAFELALIFDDPTALSKLSSDAADRSADVTLRRRALDALVAKHAADLPILMLALLDDEVLRRDAIRALGQYDHPGTAEALLARYSSFAPEERHDALQTLASRVSWAKMLLDAFEEEQLVVTDLTAYTARQLHNLGDTQVTERISNLWGEIRPTAKEKSQLISQLRKKLNPSVLSAADRSAGRNVFQKSCANCHRLFDAGGNIGPDITGAQRTNLDYLLENLIDPSAAVSNDFQMERIETQSGRIVTGLVISETAQALTIQTASEQLVLPVSELETRAKSPLSMMPEGLLQNLSADEVRDLIAYLSGTKQVPVKSGIDDTAPSGK